MSFFHTIFLDSQRFFFKFSFNFYAIFNNYFMTLHPFLNLFSLSCELFVWFLLIFNNFFRTLGQFSPIFQFVFLIFHQLSSTFFAHFSTFYSMLVDLQRVFISGQFTSIFKNFLPIFDGLLSYFYFNYCPFFSYFRWIFTLFSPFFSVIFHEHSIFAHFD